MYETHTADAVNYVEDALSSLQCAIGELERMSQLDASGEGEIPPECEYLKRWIEVAAVSLSACLTPEVVAIAQAEQKNFNDADARADAMSY